MGLPCQMIQFAHSCLNPALDVAGAQAKDLILYLYRYTKGRSRTYIAKDSFLSLCQDWKQDSLGASILHSIPKIISK